MDSEQFSHNHKNEYFNNYLKYLTRKFMGCFGTTKHMRPFSIRYSLSSGNTVDITLNVDGYIRFRFDDILKNRMNELINETADMFLKNLFNEPVNSIMDNISAIGIMKRHLRDRLYDIFKNDHDIVYIPAGRSLLATMSEQLQDVSISEMDLTMQEFINLIRATKSRFGNKIPDIVKDYTKTVKGQINNSAVAQAYELIRKILKADYTSENDGEKMYFNEHQWVKLMYSSSGQQEVLWILMLAFVIILEKKKTLVVIEEPEAHLFPIAQKDIVSLIALMVNATDSKVILTTHSPYILTSTNILLYSGKTEGGHIREGRYVVPRSLRIAYNNFDAFKVEDSADGSLESLLDEESYLISTDYIDSVSAITNDELERLIEMEMSEE